MSFASPVLPARLRGIESACWALGFLVFLGWCLLILGPPGIPGRGLDFRIFYTAASLPLSELYELETQKQFQAELWREYGSFVASPFPRPPFYAFLLKPLAMLGYVPALHAWLALLVLALGASGLLLRSLYGASYGVCFVFIGFYPIAVSLRNGQDSALILLALLLGLKFHRRDKFWLAAACWAFAFQKFNLLYLLPVVLLVHHQRKLLQRLAVLGVGLAVASVSAIGHAGFDAYLNLLTNGSLDELFWTAWNIRAIVWHFGWSQPLYVLVTVAAIAGSVWLIRKLPFETAVWFSVAASLLLSWHSYCYDYTVALPFFLLAWRQFRAYIAAAALAGAFWPHFVDEAATSWLIAAALLALGVELAVKLRSAACPAEKQARA
jgi:hypothetical protein